MIEHFATLEDIFADSAFDSLVAGIRTVRVDAVSPEIEKFLEIVSWIRENGREPQKSRQIKERQLYSRLKALRSDDARKKLVSAYDEFGLLGDSYAG